MRHRVYRLKNKVSLMGLELTDWFVVLLSWLVFKQILGSLLGARLGLLVAIIGTFLVFKVWQRVKDTIPDQYFLHLMAWLTEADVYCLKPDRKNVPLVVYPEALKTLSLEDNQKTLTKEVSHDVALT